jgi:hypothetical protein
MVKRMTSQVDEKRVIGLGFVRLIVLSTLRENKVNETKEKGHGFTIGDYVRILWYKKKERVNEIAH